MCGIAGAISLDGRPLQADRLGEMVNVIAHRGPDDAGYLVWQTGRGSGGGGARRQAFTNRQFSHISPELPTIDSEDGRRELASGPWDVFLGHRRLAIIDLSPRGHQPMSNRAENIWVSYNGEIYNFRELRGELQSAGHTFRSRSDTEVLIHAYQQWGIECVERFNGMFALALWDGRKGLMHLARDRYGIKPLYTMQCDSTVLFASEIKSILAYLRRAPPVDLLAMNEYFSFQNTFTDRTLFEGVRLLAPGHIMTVEAASGKLTARKYWDFDFHNESDMSPEALQEQLAERIHESVSRQCVSDVPIGSYLSGGMDSGTITALTAKQFGRIFTFTGGFNLSEAASHELNFDERELAEKMANLFQTEHYECVLHSGDMEAVMGELVWHLEDLRVGQCYPNYYMARLAGKFVKVVMSGAGGDELFGGYPWRYAAAIGAEPSHYVENYYRYWQRLVDNTEKLQLYTPGIMARLKAAGSEHAMPFENQTLNAFKGVFGRDVRAETTAQQVNESLYFECKTFLHGLLVVEDKLSMAHSLETRVPFLDNELVDLACRIPVRYKVPGFEGLRPIDPNVPRSEIPYDQRLPVGKSILRKAMNRWLPEEIIAAKKQGFSAPDESWFRGRGEQYVRDVLLAKDAKIHEYIQKPFISQTLDAHCSNRENKRLLIWSLLSFDTWLRQFQIDSA